MAALAHDTRRTSLGQGLVLAVVSAVSFGMSGSLARGLLSAGWSPGAIVTARIGIAAVALAPFAIASLRGRWRALYARSGTVVLYGLIAVVGTQFCYFSAVSTMDVGPALLIEYTAPALVVAWLWLRHAQRPRPLTVAGAGAAALGLAFVLDIGTGAHLAWSGVGWALAAMVGAASYFVISADTDSGVPPLALAGAGLLVGVLALGVLGGFGLLPMHASTSGAAYAVGTPPWWLPVLTLGLVTAALAYVTGIAASRRLGSRLASFVALLEVVAAVGFAWLLVAQHPSAYQFLGGLLVIAGVAVVKIAE